MSRVLRFRAWNGYTMVIPYLYRNMAYLTGRDLEDGNSYSGPVMQFTGLQDKNGVDIFEGDILSIYYPYYSCENGWEAPVIFSTDYVGGWVLSVDGGESNLNIGTRTDHVRVAGNIHQNPELLEAS